MVTRENDLGYKVILYNKLKQAKPVIDNSSPRYCSPLVNSYKPKIKKNDNPPENINEIDRLREIYKRKEPVIIPPIRSLNFHKRKQEAELIDTQNKKLVKNIKEVKPRYTNTDIMKFSNEVTKGHNQMLKGRQVRTVNPVTFMIKRSLSRNIESVYRKDSTDLYLEQLASRNHFSKTASHSKLLKSSPLRQVFDSSYVSHISSITPEPTSYYREKMVESTVNTSYL